MQKPSAQKTSSRICTRSSAINPNSRDTSLGSISNKGRGSTPLVRKFSSEDSLANSQSTTCVRALRNSPVSSSVVSVQSDRPVVAQPISNRELSVESLPNIGTESSIALVQSLESVENQDNQINIETDSGMVSKDTNPEGSRQPPNVNNIENLMAYFQEVIRTTQDNFRSEFNALRESVGLAQNDRWNSATKGIRTPGSQVNSFSNVSSNSHFKLKDWKISYNGEGDVNDFLFKIDTLTERSQCPHDHLMSNFHLFLTGKAETFYSDFIRLNQRANYATLREALSKEFDKLESDHEILLKISTRRQLPKERYDDFHSYIVHLNLRLSNPMSDASLIEIIKKNVHADLKVMLFISDFKDLNKLRDLARKAEKVLSENKTGTLGRQQQINEITTESETEFSDAPSDPQVEAHKVNGTWVNNDYSKIKCWNCLQLGHSYIYCPNETRNIFCYKCGQKGVTTPKCNDPHTLNKKRSEWTTGATRSSN